MNTDNMNDLITILQKRLKKPLPGIEAQKMMMPQDRSRERFNVEKVKNARLGGVMILFYKKNNEWYIPLTQRHEYNGTHSGQVSFPGGKMDEIDIDIEYTAMRETHEEIGVSNSLVEVIGRLTPLYIPPSNFSVTPVVAVATSEVVFQLDAYEVKELIEVPVDLFKERAIRKRKNIIVNPSYSLDSPYFDIFGKVVWGATAMILSELVFILDEIDFSY